MPTHSVRVGKIARPTSAKLLPGNDFAHPTDRWTIPCAQIRYNGGIGGGGGRMMDFSLSPEQQQIRDEVRKLSVKFDDADLLEKDPAGHFPPALHAALAPPGGRGTS